MLKIKKFNFNTFNIKINITLEEYKIINNNNFY